MKNRFCWLALLLLFPALVGQATVRCTPRIKQVTVGGMYRNFEYIDAPSGTQVEIKGEYLRVGDGEDRVYLGNEEIRPEQFISFTGRHIVFAVDPDEARDHPEGPVDIKVTTSGGSDTCTNCFTYVKSTWADRFKGLYDLRGYNLPPGHSSTGGFDVVDIDGDGDQDIVAAMGKDGIRIYRRGPDENGDGVPDFSSLDYDPDPGHAFTTEVATFMFEGHPYIFVANGTNSIFYRYPNLLLKVDWKGERCMDSFSEECVTEVRDPDWAKYVTTSVDKAEWNPDEGEEDINGDGVADFVTANRGHVRKHRGAPDFLYLSNLSNCQAPPCYDVTPLNDQPEEYDYSVSVRFADVVRESPNQNLKDIIVVNEAPSDEGCLRIYQQHKQNGVVIFEPVALEDLFKAGDIPTGTCRDVAAGYIRTKKDSQLPPDLFVLRSKVNNLLYAFDPVLGRYKEILDNDGRPIVPDDRDENNVGILDDNGEIIPYGQAHDFAYGTRFEAALADVDRDGHMDIIASGERNSVYLNTGSGKLLFRMIMDNVNEDGEPFAPHQLSRSHKFSSEAVQVVYLNGNPRDNNAFPDLIVGNRGEQNHLLLNKGGGRAEAWWGFETRTIARGVFPADGAASFGVALADLRGADGITDALFLANGQAGVRNVTSYAYRNAFYISPEQDGRFVPVPNADGQGRPYWPYNDQDNSRDVVWADVDGVNGLDLFVANVGQNRLYLNVSDGRDAYPRFEAPPPEDPRLPPEADASYGAAAGYIDEDPFIDLVVANGTGCKVYFNDGTGHFLPENEVILADSATARAVALGNLDQDGGNRLDIVVARFSTNLVYLNQGGRSFDRVVIDDKKEPSQDVLVIDLDKKNGPDVVFANGGQMKNVAIALERDRIYLNTGRQGTTWSGLVCRDDLLPGERGAHNSVAAADLDNDGDLDLIFTVATAIGGGFENVGFTTSTKIFINFLNHGGPGLGLTDPEFGDLTAILLEMPLEGIHWGGGGLFNGSTIATSDSAVYRVAVGTLNPRASNPADSPDFFVLAEDGQTRLATRKPLPAY